MWDHGVLIESAAHISILQGIIAGLCGGAAMALAMMALSRAVGQSPLHMPKRLASVLLGPGAKDGGPGVIALGFAMHVALSAGFGALFAIVADRLTHEFWMTGVAYALTLWVINYWGSQITPGGREMSQAHWAWLSPLAHIVYGGVMAAIAVTFAASAMGSG
jgi:hypothetical protein